jgi:predicted ATPase/DNA-binding XRE family transcriptional regulator
MKGDAPGAFGAQLKALRDAAGFTQEELATISGLSVHAVSALERGERRRPHFETVRALAAALDLAAAPRDAFIAIARAPVPTAAADELSSVSLPVPLTPLLGRESDVETLRRWLTDPAARLITLIGPGGVGKTRLGLELARVIAEEGGTRVVFVSLAAIRDVAFVASAIAEALGLADVTAIDLVKCARAACEGHATLILLDNFEQVLSAAPLVADLLMSIASLRVLVTSRAPLHLRGEREYALGPLELRPGSETMPPADVAQLAAVRLFVERVRDVQPTFRLTATNRATVTGICRRLDTLPLALELAAPWMKVLSLEELLRRLTDDVLLSPLAPRDLPERQQTMNATVAWSYGLLASNEQRAFRHFGALPGLFPIDAAAAVLAGREDIAAGYDNALVATAALMDKCLLLRADISVIATCPLYYMLDTVRTYAGRELAAAGERDAAMEGLVRYCAAEARSAAGGLVGPAQAEWLDRVRENLASYRGALAWLLEHDRPAEAIAIAWSLMFFWLIRGHAGEGRRWYQQILSQPSLPPAAESRALVGTALMCYMQGDLSGARAVLPRALQLARNSGDVEMIAHAEIVCGHIEHADGNVNLARDHFTRSAKEFATLAIPWGVGNALSGMAGVVLATGEAAHAERLLDEATSVLRGVGPFFLAVTLYVRATVAVRRGSADDAIVLVREGLTCIRDLQDKFTFVATLVPLAVAAVMKGDDAWAARILGARDAVIERTGITLIDSPVRDLREQTEREARVRLGPNRWAREYAAGRSASIDTLLRDIDSARA